MSQKTDNHAEPVAVDDELHLTVAGGRAQLTPRSALTLAEDLARRGFRRMLTEEANRFEGEAHG